MIFYIQFLTAIDKEVDLLWFYFVLMIKKLGEVVFMLFVEISHKMMVCHIICDACQSMQSKPIVLEFFSRKKHASLFSLLFGVIVSPLQTSNALMVSYIYILCYQMQYGYMVPISYDYYHLFIVEQTGVEILQLDCCVLPIPVLFYLNIRCILSCVMGRKLFIL